MRPVRRTAGCRDLSGIPDRGMMTATVGYVELLRRNGDFRRLFAARLVSFFGDWFNLLALLALLRAIGADSASAFGGVIVLKMLPNLFVAPFAGVIADRLPRRLVMVASDLVRAGLVLGLFVVWWVPSPTLVYVLIVLLTVASAFFDPARNAMLPTIVRPEELTAANALGAASWSLMLAFGSAAGGYVTTRLGWEVALVVDAASFLLSAALLVGIREPPIRATRVRRRDALELTGLRDVFEGAAWLMQRPRVWTMALVKPLWRLAGATTLVLTLLGETAWGGPVAGGLGATERVAVLYVARGVGTGLGPFLARWWSASEPAAMERLIGVAFVGAGVFYLLLGVAPGLAVASVLVVLAHLGGSTIWVFSTIRLQQLTPDGVRGRVFAAEQAGFTVMVAITTFAWGAWSDAGASPSLLALGLGVITFVPAALWFGRGAWLGWATGDPIDAEAAAE